MSTLGRPHKYDKVEQRLEAERKAKREWAQRQRDKERARKEGRNSSPDFADENLLKVWDWSALTAFWRAL